MSEELKPCPFCGNAISHQASQTIANTKEGTYFWRVCNNCSACGPAKIKGEAPEFDALKAWNTRPTQTPETAPCPKCGDLEYVYIGTSNNRERTPCPTCQGTGQAPLDALERPVFNGMFGAINSDAYTYMQEMEAYADTLEAKLKERK